MKLLKQEIRERPEDECHILVNRHFHNYAGRILRYLVWYNIRKRFKQVIWFDVVRLVEYAIQFRLE